MRQNISVRRKVGKIAKILSRGFGAPNTTDAFQGLVSSENATLDLSGNLNLYLHANKMLSETTYAATYATLKAGTSLWLCSV